MKPVNFEGCNTVFADGQPDYIPLPGHVSVSWRVTTCWQCSFWERIQILFTGRVWLATLTFGAPLQPVRIDAKKPVLHG